VAEDKIEQNANTAVREDSGTSQEVKNAVTPEMVAAGKLAIDESSKSESLENSVGKIYVAMAMKDRDALREKDALKELKQDKRFNFWLYCAVIAMLILGGALITIIVVKILS